MMTSKNWDAAALFFKITTVLKLSPMLLTQKMPWPTVFLTSKISPLQSALTPPCSPIFSPFILIPLSAFESTGFLPLQHRNPLHQHGKHTPHYFSCTYKANSLPSVFSLLHHQESIWIRGRLQGTQTKAQNGPTTLPKTDLELMGLSHVGFGSENY